MILVIIKVTGTGKMRQGTSYQRYNCINFLEENNSHYLVFSLPFGTHVKFIIVRRIIAFFLQEKNDYYKKFS